MGLPYVPLHVIFPRGKEAIALRVVLQKPKAWAYVAEMWCGVAQNAPDGRVEGPAAVAQLEEWAGWDGAPGAFVEALALPHIGLLDVTERGFYVHNWDIHCGAHIDRLEKDRIRKAEARAAAKAAEEAAKSRTSPDTSGERPGTVRGPSADKNRMSAPEGKGEGKQELDLPDQGAAAPRLITPLVAFVRETYPDIRDPWAFEAAAAKAYPRVDLLAEALKARAWEVAAPKRAKKNHGTFLNRWFSNATPAPLPRTHGDLGSEIHPWPSRLTPEQKAQARAELAALHPDLADAPLGITGDPAAHPVDAIAALNERWRRVAEARP